MLFITILYWVLSPPVQASRERHNLEGKKKKIKFWFPVNKTIAWSFLTWQVLQKIFGNQNKIYSLYNPHPSTSAFCLILPEFLHSLHWLQGTTLKKTAIHTFATLVTKLPTTLHLYIIMTALFLGDVNIFSCYSLTITSQNIKLSIFSMTQSGQALLVFSSLSLLGYRRQWGGKKNPSNTKRAYYTLMLPHFNRSLQWGAAIINDLLRSYRGRLCCLLLHLLIPYSHFNLLTLIFTVSQ